MGVTPEELAEVYPRLYHMADAQSCCPDGRIAMPRPSVAAVFG